MTTTKKAIYELMGRLQRLGVRREDNCYKQRGAALTYQKNVAGALDLVHIVRLCKFEVSFGIQPSNVGE